MRIKTWGGAIREFAIKYGFSYLYIHLDLLAQAQNTAIKVHPNAKWIFKIDEDIILSDNYFARMKSAYEKADKELPYKVGFLGPLINLNAVCTPYFLKVANIENEYEKEFGKYRVYNKATFMTADVHSNLRTACFIWEHTIPFDNVAKLVENAGDEIIMAPIRFSIGAILCTREFWERIGYFKLSPVGSGAAEETQMNTFCQDNMLSIAIATNILVGHLGFHPQKEACRKFFEEHIEEIKHQ